MSQDDLLNQLESYNNPGGAVVDVDSQPQAPYVEPQFTEPIPWYNNLDQPVSKTPAKTPPKSAPKTPAAGQRRRIIQPMVPGPPPIRHGAAPQPVGPGPTPQPPTPTWAQPQPQPAPQPPPVAQPPMATMPDQPPGPVQTLPQPEEEADELPPSTNELMWRSLLGLIPYLPWVTWFHCGVLFVEKSKEVPLLAATSLMFGIGSWLLLTAIVFSLPPFTERMRIAVLLIPMCTSALFLPASARLMLYPLLTLGIYLLAADGIYVKPWQRKAIRIMVALAITWPIVLVVKWLL